MQEAKLRHEDALNYITGGHALFTIRNSKNGNRFTYKVSCPEQEDVDDPSFLFVKVLTGPDNGKSYTYMGVLSRGFSGWDFKMTAKSKLSSDAPSVIAFSYIIQLLKARMTHKDLEIWHSGVCARCGRTLTTPESIQNGIGPECARIKARKNFEKTQK